MSTPFHPIPGEKTTLGYSTVIPATTYTSLSTTLVTAIDIPGYEVEDVETTPLDSSAETYRPGLIVKADEMNISLFYDPNDAGIIELQTLAAAPVPTAWQITFNANNTTTQPTATFVGYLKKFTPGKAEKNKNFEAEAVIKVSGLITFTPGV